MRSRPVVVFLTDIVPYPPPLIGSMLRVGRLARELSQEFDVAVVCQSEYDSQTLASNWKIEHSSFPIVSVPKPVRDPARDALWGSPTSVVESTLLTLVADRAPRVFDSAWSDVFVEEIRRLLSRAPDAVVWAHKSFMAEMARAANDGVASRKAAGIGLQYNHDDFDKTNYQTLGQFLQSVPGLRVADPRSASTMAMTRSTSTMVQNTLGSRGSDCHVGWYVDGHRMDLPGRTDPMTDGLASFSLDGIEAVEVFRGLSETPAQFADPDLRCGVVAVWTRR